MKKHSFTIQETGNGWIGWNNNVPGVNCQEKNPKKLIKSLIQVTLIIQELEEARKEPLQVKALQDSDQRLLFHNSVHIGVIDFSYQKGRWFFCQNKNVKPQIELNEYESYYDLLEEIKKQLKIEE